MMRGIVVFSVGMLLAGCSIDPGATWAPDILKDRAPRPAAIEPPPDMRTMLQTRIGEFFLPQSSPSNISFSVPRRTKLGWSDCIRATLTGAVGNSLGEQTYLVSIEGGKPMRSENVSGNAHWCSQETFERL